MYAFAMNPYHNDPRTWTCEISGAMTGMVFDSLQLKLAELEANAQRPGNSDADRLRYRALIDACVEAIYHVAGPGRDHLAESEIAVVRRDLGPPK